MSTDDRYAEVAVLYDAMVPEDPERASFFGSVFQRHKVRTVLDCACGTGSDLLMFHRMGYEVTGSDLSDAMLKVAESKLRDAGAAIPLAKVDFQQLPQHYPRRFDAIVCLSNSINEEAVDAEAALRSMEAVLRPGGLIVFDQGQTDCSLKDPPRFVPVVNTPDLSRLFTIDYQDDIMAVRIFDFVHEDGQSRYEFHHSEHRIRLRRCADWERILSSVSMRGEYYGSWRGEPYDKESMER